MKTNVVAKRDFGAFRSFARLDPEFVDPDFLAVEHAMEAKPGSRLYNLVADDQDSLDQEVVADEEVDDEESSEGEVAPDDEVAPDKVLVSYIPIDAVDTEDGFVFHDLLFERDLPSRAKYQVDAGDILVSNVRPNRGAVTLLSERSAGAIASSGFTLVRLQPGSTISKQFVFAFLKTRFGRDQLIRRNRGSMYPAVLGRDVFEVWVPKPTEDVESLISASVGRALAFQEEFYSLQTDLERMLETFLAPYGHAPSPLEGDKRPVDWTEVNATDIYGPSGAHRFDAEFFRQSYCGFDAHIQSLGNSFLLGQYFDLAPGRALKADQTLSPYAKQAVLTNMGVNWSALSEERGTLAPGAWTIKAGDILLACTAHEIAYVGRKVDFVRRLPTSTDQPIGCVPDLLVLRPRSSKPQALCGSYVAAFLRHPAGLHQVQRCIRGLRGGHVYRDDLSKFVRVPVPSDEWLTGYEDLALRCEAARNNAKEEMVSAFARAEEFVNSIL